MKTVEINKYKVADGVKLGDFITNGFRNRNGYVSDTCYLYEDYIRLILMIDESGYMIPSVTCEDGETYGPFHNPDLRYNNLVYNEVAKNYNKYMDKLVKKKLLVKEEDKPMGNKEKILIKYHDDDLQKLEYIDGKSDWIDLRAAEDVKLKKGEFKLISLGVSMKLPDGYEAHIVPRSSTFKNFGIIQTNHFGVIDQSYSGTNDIWKFPAYAMRDTEIHKNDRICQFRIIENQPKVDFIEVDKLEDSDRGGFGSTGKN